MQVMNARPDENALTIDQSASVLGLHQFSLLSRVQAGRINSVRARSGEIMIPASELERLARSPIGTHSVPRDDRQAKLSDERLGIERTNGLKRSGESIAYRVPGHVGGFTETEITGYRAAFGGIASELESLTGLKKQLAKDGFTPSEKEIHTPEIGRWLVRTRLLNLGQSEILLCQRADYDFAIVERFRSDSRYAKANGRVEILSQGERNRPLTEEFKANAQLTLEFMASNLVAKAQKVVWEQYPDDRPGQIVAAISERCRQAAANEETISLSQKLTPSTRRGMRV